MRKNKKKKKTIRVRVACKYASVHHYLSDTDGGSSVEMIRRETDAPFSRTPVGSPDRVRTIRTASLRFGRHNTFRFVVYVRPAKRCGTRRAFPKSPDGTAQLRTSKMKREFDRRRRNVKAPCGRPLNGIDQIDRWSLTSPPGGTVGGTLKYTNYGRTYVLWLLENGFRY